MKLDKVPPGQQPKITMDNIFISFIWKAIASPQHTNGIIKNWTTVATIAPTGLFACMIIFFGSIVTPKPVIRKTNAAIRNNFMILL